VTLAFAVVAAALVAHAFKMLSSRARPDVFFETGRMWNFPAGFRRTDFASFPSAHAAAAFVMTAVLSRAYPRGRGVFFAAAILCAASRVLDLEHYLSDVLAGAGLGVLLGALFCRWRPARDLAARLAGETPTTPGAPEGAGSAQPGPPEGARRDAGGAGASESPGRMAGGPAHRGAPSESAESPGGVEGRSGRRRSRRAADSPREGGRGAGREGCAGSADGEIRRVGELLRSARRAVAFTGAGASTLSGIRDFRGAGGIYEEYDPERLFSIRSFVAEPEYFYRVAGEFIYRLDEKEPNIVHRECARLEREGHIGAVITQNIDMLHQKAGSENVIELHGSPRVHRCLECAREYGYEEVKGRVLAGEVPRCECGGVLKPGVTFFHERLPEGALERAARAASAAEVMLVLGSSLVVEPAAWLPRETLRAGGRLVIVNRQPTPMHAFADTRFADLEDFFTRLSSFL